MEMIAQAWNQYGAAHPFLSHLIVAIAAPFAVKKAEGAIPMIVDRLETYQESALKRAGLTEDQLISVEEHEVKDLRASADELEAKLNARKEALTKAPAGQGDAPKVG